MRQVVRFLDFAALDIEKFRNTLLPALDRAFVGGRVVRSVIFLHDTAQERIEVFAPDGRRIARPEPVGIALQHVDFGLVPGFAHGLGILGELPGKTVVFSPAIESRGGKSASRKVSTSFIETLSRP